MDSKLNFEESLKRLEEIVSRLENGSMPLEEMVNHVEQGAKLIKTCRASLENMNSKVEILFKDDGADGEFTEFDLTTERAQAAGTPTQERPRRKAPPAVAPPQDDLPF